MFNTEKNYNCMRCTSQNAPFFHSEMNKKHNTLPFREEKDDTACTSKPYNQ